MARLMPVRSGCASSTFMYSARASAFWPALNSASAFVNSPELLTKAEALFKAGQNAEARAEYMKVLEAHPDLTGINRAIAFTYGREGHHPEALKYLDLALASNPDDRMLLQ